MKLTALALWGGAWFALLLRRLRVMRRMQQSLKLGALGGLLVVVGCTAPRKIEYDFIPPASSAGLACLQRCDVSARQCEAKLQSAVNQCWVQAGRQAKIELPGRIAAYENSLRVWEAAMRNYERDISMYELQMRHYRLMEPLSYQDCYDRHGKRIRNCRRSRHHLRTPLWSARPVFPGEAPKRPTFERVQADIAAKTCGRKSDQCEVSYQQCYTRCGGTVKAR